MSASRPIKRALLSVSDKSGIVELATTLSEYGVEILSTGGTAKLLEANGITNHSILDGEWQLLLDLLWQDSSNYVVLTHLLCFPLRSSVILE